jgi:transitional endoplasmic reticulum ATPase
MSIRGHQAFLFSTCKGNHCMSTTGNGPTTTEPSLTSFVRISNKDTSPELRMPTHETTFEFNNSNKIIIPADMDKYAVAQAITDMADQEEAETQVVGTFYSHPNDVAYSFQQLLKEVFGEPFVKAIDMGFWGVMTPTQVTIPIGVHETGNIVVQGNMSVPFLQDVIFNIRPDFRNMNLSIVVTCKRKHERAVKQLFAMLKEYIKTHSIYRGKAIDSKYEFLDVSESNPSNLAFNEAVEVQLVSNIFTPIAQRERLKVNGVPFRRGVLLEGTYGTGKTIVAYAAAGLAEKHNVTFIYVRPGDQEKMAEYITIAKRYAPTVLFCEDIDQQTGGDDDDREASVTTILNALDGIDSKQDSDVMVIMTTNHVDKVNPAMLRPGRIDAVVHMTEPDATTAGRLIELYGGGVLSSNFDAERAGRACEGMVPAFIRECVERAKLYAMARDEGPLHIHETDIMYAAQGMREHLALATPKAPATDASHVFTEGMQTLVRTAVHDEVQDVPLRTLIEEVMKKVLQEQYAFPLSPPRGMLRKVQPSRTGHRGGDNDGFGAQIVTTSARESPRRGSTGN